MRKVAGASLTLSLVSAGCDLFTVPEGGAENVTIELTSEELSVARFLVTTNFLLSPIGNDLGLALLEADTLEVGLPYKETFDIRVGRRFYVELLDEDAEDPLKIQVWLDGRKRLERFNNPGGNPLQFIYVFGVALPPGNVYVL